MSACVCTAYVHVHAESQIYTNVIHTHTNKKADILGQIHNLEFFAAGTNSRWLRGIIVAFSVAIHACNYN